MLSKELELIIDKFIERCKEINSAISFKDCISIAEDIIFNANGNKPLIFRNLSYELIKLKREQHKPIKFTKVKPMAIDEFISNNIEPKFLNEIRSSFKGENNGKVRI